MTVEYDIYALAIMSAVISFLGFLLENVWLAFTKKFVDNRNMSAPFLLGYGLLVTAIYIVIGTPQSFIFSNLLKTKSKIIKYIIYFIIAMLIVSTGEILLGLFIKRFFGFDYWNYSSLPMHITKYTSLPTSIGFALVILFFMGVCFNPILAVIVKIRSSFRKILGISLSLVMITDFIKSFCKMYKTQSLNVKWRLYITDKKIVKYEYCQEKAV